MRALLLLPLLLLAPAAAAQNWSSARTVTVELTSFDYDPDVIRLRAGEPVVLRLVNPGSGGHDFSAPRFFRAATLAPGQGHVFHHPGAIEVPSGQSVSVRLVPARGEYRLKCTHTFHSLFGMRGRIVVE